MCHADPIGGTYVRRSCRCCVSAADPAWEARFIEAMSGARFRCAYLNAEESPGRGG